MQTCSMNIKGAIFRNGGNPEILLQISRLPLGLPPAHSEAL